MCVNEKLLAAMVLICFMSDVQGGSMDSMAESVISGLLVGVASAISIIFIIALCVQKSRPSSVVNGSMNVPSNGRPGTMPGTMPRNGTPGMVPGTMSRNSIPGTMPRNSIPGTPGNGIPGMMPGTMQNGYDIQLQNMRNQQVRDRFTFPRQNLTFIKELGMGQYGVVHLAEAIGISPEGEQWMKKMVAVKTVKANARSLDKVNFLRELDLMKKLKSHRNVLGLMGCCIETEPFLIIVQYVANGNLLQLLANSRNAFIPSPANSYGQLAPPVDQRTLLRMAKHVADGMAHLASQKCIHRDLAARNVLVGADFSCKVSDFGRAIIGTYVVDSGIKFEGPLPLRWMAIESLVDDVHTSASDVWGFGVLLWEITTLGARPYANMAPKQVVEFVRRGYRMERPVHCGADVYDIMMACWSTDPDRRPTFNQLSRDIGRILSFKTDSVSLNRIDRRIYDGDRTFVDPFERLEL